MKTLISKTTSTALASVFLSGAVHASTKTDSEFSRLLTKHNVTPAQEQAYCYTDEKGNLQGVNLDLKVRLASVSKLLTSLWAVEELGINFRHDTRLYINGKDMHIAGSFDPFMSNEKMLFLVSQLNMLGYKEFNKITFDKNLLIYPAAQTHTDTYPTINADSNAKNLRTYFNTASWSAIFKEEYKRISKLAKTGRFLPEVTMKVDSVAFTDTIPFNKDDESVRMLTLTSPELYKYLKETNVVSNNYSSHTLFRHLGGEAKFSEWLASRYGLTNEKVKLYNGSGLPSVINGVRKDNFASCSIMMNMIDELKLSAERQGKEIEDVVAVPGSDAGTFRNRLNSADYKNTFVAKTGTLMHTSTLAGAMSTVKGFSFFGIFNMTTALEPAKQVQNYMVGVLMTEMGGPKVFNYTVEGFHTYHKDENVKNLEDLFQEETDFSPIEGQLY